MTRRPEWLVRVAAACVVLFTIGLYLTDISRAPVYLGWDEARTAMQAYSLVTTGRDMDGNPTPLFFHITDPLIPNHSSVTWWQPMLFYLTAAVLSVAPLAVWAIRLPNIVVGVLNVWLVYAISRRLFVSPWYAVLAALLVALTPAHFFFARLAQDYFLPLPFALLWLWILLRYLQAGPAWLPIVIGLVLGAGMYTHISAWIVMPFYLGLTTVVLWASGKPLRALVGLCIGFAVALVPIAAWLAYHPSLLRDMFANYKVPTGLNLSERVSLYWDYFNPSYLFFSGGADLMWATRRAGVLLLPISVLLPCGLWAIWKGERSMGRMLVVAAFLFAPVPIVAALPEAPRYATARNLLVVPFAILISVAGVEVLLASRRSLGRAIVVLLLLSVPLQFAMFAYDYFGDYQLRSSYRHDFLNVRGVAEYVVAADASTPVPAVYFSDDVSAGKVIQWKFHLTTHHRPDLWDRTKYISIENFRWSDIPPGSLLVLTGRDERVRDLVGPDRCTVVQTVTDVTGAPAAAVLRRN